MSGIKAIETSYKGYRFRSRLEARWAVFFDSLPIRWRYETQGFVVQDLFCYLPDFYLPDWDLYLEIKPDLPYECVTPDNSILVVANADGITPLGKFLLAATALYRQPSGSPPVGKGRLLMLCGTPGGPRLQEYRGRWKLNDGAVALACHNMGGDGPLVSINAWSDDDNGRLDIWPFYTNGEPFSAEQSGQMFTAAHFPTGTITTVYLGPGRRYSTPRLAAAYTAARSARFEYGETPK